MATKKQKELKAKQLEAKLNRALAYVYGMEDMLKDSKLEKVARKVITDLDWCDDNAKIATRKSDYTLHLGDSSFNIHFYSQEHDSLEDLEDGQIKVLKRKSLIKEYTKLLKNNDNDNFELISYNVFIFQSKKHSLSQPLVA